MRRLMLVLSIALATTALVAGSATADDDDGEGAGARTWRVTVANLTPPGSQPLSPPLFVVHSNKADVWSVGEIASHGVAAIAEDANNAVLEAALANAPGIRTASTGAGGPIPSGQSRTYTVETSGRFSRLSLVTMLVNTNDAFTGLDSFRPSGHGETVRTMAYDAGSERNNELKSHIPGPCCGNPFVRDPEGALIRHHEGITGRGELSPATYDWDGPAARIMIQRAS
jgi:Spondin_N